MKTIFLDFDGVLFNSVKAGYLLARYAYYGVDVFEPLDSNYELFAKNRFLVSNSWQYFYILKLIDEGVFDMREAFIFMMENRDKVADDAFNQKFVAKRKDLIKNHPELWGEIDEAYSFFFDIKELVLQKEMNFVILSTNNKVTLENALQKYGVPIPSSKIFGKEHLLGYASKAEFLQEYMQENHIENALFVEDNKGNLDACRHIKNLKLLLVDWGYVDPLEKGFTKEEILKEIRK